MSEARARVAAVWGIATVVTGAVFYELDQILVGFMSCFRDLIQNIADGLHNGQVGRLIHTTNVIGLTRSSIGQYKVDRFAMIFHMQPITYLLSITVYR